MLKIVKRGAMVPVAGGWCAVLLGAMLLRADTTARASHNRYARFDIGLPTSIRCDNSGCRRPHMPTICRRRNALNKTSPASRIQVITNLGPERGPPSGVRG